MENKAIRTKPDGLVSSIPFCRGFHGKRYFKFIVFLLIVILDTADLASDWLLYNDVANTKEGLVYGPLEGSIRYALLVTCIIGTQSITIEIINLSLEIFRGNPWFDLELLSAVIIWIEDVPQITINVVIIACREEAISYFQLVKASVLIAGAIIRVLFSLILYCSNKAIRDIKRVKKNHESRSRVFNRALIMTGLIITLGGAAMVFLFTQYERNPDGTINFKVPNSYVEGEYDDAKYFNNVSIYFSHELFDWNTTASRYAEHRNLFRLFKINEIRQEKVDRMIIIQYDELTGPTKFVIKESDMSGNVRVNECFQMDRTGKNVTIGSNCTAYIALSINEFVFKFRYIKPYVPKLIFGDIKYNIKVKYNSASTCKSPDYVISNSIKDQSNKRVASLHYYRTKGSLDETNHVIHTSATHGTFYHSRSLQDIRDVWKTGFAHCKSTGSLAPHHDDSIDVQCT
ncbi:uncharacterized protein LOC123533264 [Mercenaria mercenaria]|uniref:uncharacterized protein LOC123533264 n=1 Tax=Mercenaria mercenaria TaxID=6596 RepID=UPI00234F79DF|nr:uncharacterized protein LOC123533264 [Mercenaria mercenaria]